MLLTRQPSKTEFSFRIMQSDIIISASLGRDNFLNIGLVPPMTARGISRGLLGNYDGDQSNDLKSKGCVFLLFFRMPFPPPNFKGFFTDSPTFFSNAEIDNYKSVYIEDKTAASKTYSYFIIIPEISALFTATRVFGFFILSNKIAKLIILIKMSKLIKPVKCG